MARGNVSATGAGRSRECPLSEAIAVATSNFAALVPTRPERGPQLLVDGRLDRDADVLVDQFTQRDGLRLMRSGWLADTLAHRVFLRRPPWKAARWSCTSPTGRMGHFSFHQTRDTTEEVGSQVRRLFEQWEGLLKAN